MLTIIKRCKGFSQDSFWKYCVVGFLYFALILLIVPGVVNCNEVVFPEGFSMENIEEYLAQVSQEKPHTDHVIKPSYPHGVIQQRDPGYYISESDMNTANKIRDFFNSVMQAISAYVPASFSTCDIPGGKCLGDVAKEWYLGYKRNKYYEDESPNGGGGW
jgi:hypothetical protein